MFSSPCRFVLVYSRVFNFLLDLLRDWCFCFCGAEGVEMGSLFLLFLIVGAPVSDYGASEEIYF